MNHLIKCVDAGTACASCEDCPYNKECLVWAEINRLRTMLDNQIFISQNLCNGLINLANRESNEPN